ncbi:MAG TPA: hypothetical protein VLS48_06590 [Anaerolineales bacterium]|nr:hypothetical protein [Anaerolineales bacterium]
MEPSSNRPVSHPAEQLPSGSQQNDAVELYTRLMLGLIILGGDELLKRLRMFQVEIAQRPDLQARFNNLDQESGSDLLRYLLVGGLARGRRKAAGFFQAGVNFSFRSAARALNLFYDITDNFVLRPLQRPVDALLIGSEDIAHSLVDEGRVVEQQGRLLANLTVHQVIDEFIDTISENEQLAQLVRAQIGQQSIGLAEVVVDNSRRISSAADGLLEGFVRRVLRLRTRRELPASPLAGQPQVMYLPDDEAASTPNFDPPVR